MKIRNAIFALSVFVIAAGVVNAQTRTYSLVNGDSLAPASPSVGLDGVTTFYGGFVNGGVVSSSPATFTFAITFRQSEVIDAAAGIYSGSIVAPSSSFAVTHSVGRKSVSTSGSIDAGTVTYRLTADGRADIIGVVSNNLTIWEGKNRRRVAVGNGSVDYGTTTEGEGTIVLNTF